MVVTVSTVKDSLANVQRFVLGNLAGGVDHMIIFLDAPDPEVEEWLASRPEVTAVVTDDTWWRQRPALLNRRQNINANVAKAILTLADWADWLFHIDADEIIALDRRALAQVPADESAVRLRPFEAVSTLHGSQHPTTYKRLLNDRELQDLTDRGVIGQPSNSVYFRSYIIGKAGIRPRLDRWMQIHNIVDADGTRQEHVRNPGFRVLHLESVSGEEFVRKWTNMIGSGPSVNFGEHRSRLAAQIREAITTLADPAQRAERLEEIYRESMEDDVELLDSLGFLVAVDPRAGRHQPRVLTAGQRAQLRGWLDELRPHAKGIFLRGGADAGQVEALLAEVAASVPEPTDVQQPSSGPMSRLLGRLRK